MVWYLGKHKDNFTFHLYLNLKHKDNFTFTLTWLYSPEHCNPPLLYPRMSPVLPQVHDRYSFMHTIKFKIL
jgi:hypothetical protein